MDSPSRKRSWGKKEQYNLGYIHDTNLNPVSDVKKRSDDNDGEGGVQLQRNLGLGSGISIIVGTIIGSGIWVTPGFIMTYSESVGVYLLQWALAGILSALGAMCYIELACVVPLSGGETVYLKAAFGDFISFVFSWLRAVVLGPTSCAFLAGVSAKYILLISPAIKDYLEDTSIGFAWTVKLVAVALMSFSTIVNIVSARGAAIVQNVVTVSKMVGVVIVIIGGFVRLGQGHVKSFETGFDRLEFLDPLGPASIGLIAFNGLWNYDGWNQLNFVAEEIKEPMKNLPRSILISMPIVVIVYVLMNVSYLSAMSAQELFESEAVGVQWAEVVLGSWSWIIPLFVFISAFGTLHASLFASGRQVYSAGREGHLPEVISYVNKYTLTPLPGLLFTAVLCLVFTLLNDIDALLNMYMVAASFFYGLCMLALIVLRFKRRDVDRAFKIWIGVPVFIMVFFWYCTIAPLTEIPDPEPVTDAVLNGTTAAPPSTPIVGNFAMYQWNLICLAPGLLLYILRWGWRKYYDNSYGIKNKPIPGSDVLTSVVKRLLCVVDDRDQD